MQVENIVRDRNTDRIDNRVQNNRSTDPNFVRFRSLNIQVAIIKELSFTTRTYTYKLDFHYYDIPYEAHKAFLFNENMYKAKKI